MIIKEFIDENGINLIIEHNKNNIIFKTDDKNIQKDYYLNLYFSESILKGIIEYLTNISYQIWSDFKPKEADSISSDYQEYYDRKYDNNGYLSILKENGFKIEKPYIDCPYMYKFNKRRMESLIYDLTK
jgi:hypothetical protein